MASKYIGEPEKLRKFERLFWFTIEFALLETNEGRRIFGAGVLSSKNECNYSLSDEPEVLPFDLKVISEQEFDISRMQERIFVLENLDHLYSCLDEYESLVNSS